MNYYGAKAKVYLKFKGDIDEVAQLLCKGLEIPEFNFETDQDPPHYVTGQCESLGFSIWLNRIYDNMSYDFLLEIETDHSLEAAFNNSLCDISPWLARYVSEICKIEAAIEV